MLADRDILAHREFVIAEAVAALVVIGISLVMEGPMAAGLPDQMPHFVVFVLPEALHAAALAVLLPDHGVEMAFRIERADKLVAVPVAAFRVLPVPSQFQPDLLECHGEVSIAEKPKQSIPKTVTGFGIKTLRKQRMLSKQPLASQ